MTRRNGRVRRRGTTWLARARARAAAARIRERTWRQHARRRRRLPTDLSRSDDDIGTIAGDASDRHIHERRAGLEQGRDGRRLCRMYDDRPILLDGERVLQLHRSLAHVHSVRRETLADQPDRRLARRIVCISRVG